VSFLTTYFPKKITFERKGENVIFMFTGGSPAVFAYNDEIANNSNQ